MKKLIVMLTLFAMTGVATAQETRTDENRPNPSDSKPNSDKVPDVYAISGQFERVLILRFKYEADLLAGLEQMVKANKVRNAVILSAVGSVRSYHYHVVSARAFPAKVTFVNNPVTSADITSMNGYVIDGRIHAHLTMAEADKVFGGHLEPGTTVYTFAVVTLGVLDDKVDLKRIDDKTYR